MKRPAFLFPALLVLSCHPPSCAPGTGSGTAPLAGDLAFLPAGSPRGSLFRVYLPNARSLPSGNWTRQFDFTGVSWNDVRTATAISRRHVVMAGHFVRDPTTPVVFHDRGGRPHSRRIIAIRHLNQLGDIAVGTLDAELPSGITHYPLATAGQAVPMRAVLVTDQTRTVSVHRIGSVSGGRVILGNDPRIPRTYWRKLVFGDSGNPAFIIEGGTLRLLTTFTTGGSGTGPFYGDSRVREGVMAATR